MDKLSVAVLIPALNPTSLLIDYVKGLIEEGIEKIIIVDDGSEANSLFIFENLNKINECVVLTHAVNQGKGRALKTGINYYLNNLELGYAGIVTADADGQHSVFDTVKVAESLLENNNSLVLGTRDFNNPIVPFKSKFGNKTTTNVINVLYSKRVNDTQTGLRGLPNSHLRKYLKIAGERFEYEINMLIHSILEKQNIIEVDIETIYYDDNKQTNFNTVTDSFLIYREIFKLFLKYTTSSIISALLDITLFLVLVGIFSKFQTIKLSILIGTVIARIISSFFNYNYNKMIVFKRTNKNSFLKYYILFFIQMILSWLFVTLTFSVINKYLGLIKVVVDSLLFIFSFKVQEKWVFFEGRIQ